MHRSCLPGTDPLLFYEEVRSILVHQQTSQQQTALPHHQVPTNVSFGADMDCRGNRRFLLGAEFVG